MCGGGHATPPPPPLKTKQKTEEKKTKPYLHFQTVQFLTCLIIKFHINEDYWYKNFMLMKILINIKLIPHKNNFEKAPRKFFTIPFNITNTTMCRELFSHATMMEYQITVCFANIFGLQVKLEAVFHSSNFIPVLDSEAAFWRMFVYWSEPSSRPDRVHLV